jgi:ABC-type bacteriocin/lantibiotic exporter with double-glycine peptidase domain
MTSFFGGVVSFSDNELFIVFVVALIMFAAGIIINNERCLRNAHKKQEEEKRKQEKRMAEYQNADAVHKRAIEALFHVHRITSNAIGKGEHRHDA